MTRQARGWPHALSLTAGLLSLWAMPAWSQSLESPRDSSEVGPWARGVPIQERQRALDLFDKGNTALGYSAYTEAAEDYREALKHWDHPAIHYNLALALKDFDQPAEVHHQMSEATRYGALPLDLGKYNHALEVKEQIEKSMAWLDVTCDVPGAQVILDGKTLFKAPNHYKGLIQPGMHSLFADKEGLVSFDKERGLTTAAGGRTQVDLKMYAAGDLTQMRTRWAPWMPWSVMGSGLAVAAGGGLLHWQAHNAYGNVDKEVMACNGCMPDAAISALRKRGDNMQMAAVGAYALGGAGLITGAALLFLNHPRAYLVNPETGEASLSFAPFFGNATGVQATLHH